MASGHQGMTALEKLLAYDSLNNRIPLTYDHVYGSR
jgi:hypothetical protein